MGWTRSTLFLAPVAASSDRLNVRTCEYYEGYDGDVIHGDNVSRADVRAELEELTSTVCRALNDPKRLALIYALAGGPHSVTELCALLDVSQSNISQHLSMLRDRAWSTPNATAIGSFTPCVIAGSSKPSTSCGRP